MTAYRIQLVNGRFDYVTGKMAAVKRAIEMTGAPATSCAEDLRKDWGILIRRVSESEAREVGLNQ
jgi:hypothetical protein